MLLDTEEKDTLLEIITNSHVDILWPPEVTVGSCENLPLNYHSPLPQNYQECSEDIENSEHIETDPRAQKKGF
jgi:hypothetical protein